MQTKEVDVSGTAEVEFTPNGMEIGWSDSQIWVKYDGEVSTVELDEDGYIASDHSGENCAKGHNGEVINLAVGAYETHCDLVREWRHMRDMEAE